MKTLQKKTKIVATIGPSSEDQETLAELAQAGVGVMRLNFSHGDFDEHQKKVDRWKKLSEKEDVHLGVMQDLSGPKIRTGEFTTEEVMLEEGNEFVLTTKEVEGNKHRVYVSYQKLPQDVRPGDMILLEDGKRRLEVKSVNEHEVITEVLVGGTIKGKRGVNLPDTQLSVDALTEKDKKDLEFGVKNDVDFVALSFVQDKDDVQKLRWLMEDRGLDAQIIAKIETRQAVDNIEGILEVADGIMVARGDLAVEIGPEHVPAVQKMLIRRCNNRGMPVITATQMLESMTESPVPTRAEVSDVANAILDGTDAVMLSGETTIGDNPVESAKVMARVAKEAEQRFSQEPAGAGAAAEQIGVVDSVTASAVQTAREIGADAIVALTASGFTARMLSRFKPTQPIFALSPYKKTCNQISLSWGCHPIQTKKFTSFETVMGLVRKVCLSRGLADEGDQVVVAAGMPFVGERQQRVETNMMFVEEI